MDNEKLNDNLNDEEIILEDNEPTNKEQQKMLEIELALQEIEINIDQVENKISINGETDELYNEYFSLKEEYKRLLKEKKLQKKAVKATTGSKWDQLRPWILIYGVIIGILCLPFVGMLIWSSFSSWIMELIPGLSSMQSSSKTMFTVLLLLIYYSLPLVLILITWLLYINVVRDGFEKKVFKYIWIGQGFLTLLNGLILLFKYIIPYL